MTCYNEGRYIGAAVRSVLEQTRANLIERIMIADDGSAPNTVAVLRDIEIWDPRIEVIYGPGGAGLSAQRNRAVSRTSAPAIAILDGDALWAEAKLECQVSLLEARPDVELVYTDYFAFPNENLGAARRAGVLDIGNAKQLARTYFLSDPPIIPSSTLIRRSAFERCGGFDEFVRVFEVADFFLRLAQVCRFVPINQSLLYKRYHSLSVTGARKDLMAHHAYVAFKAAAQDSLLLPLVPKRLAERARKLGNHHFLLGNREGAVQLLSLAVRLYPFNRRAWMSFVATLLFPELALRLLGARGRERKAALGVGGS
jgi:glycosyltransferase involved in cell wall biosynthesis